MNDSTLPKPTPPKQTPLKPDQPVSPSKPVVPPASLVPPTSVAPPAPSVPKPAAPTPSIAAPTPVASPASLPQKPVVPTTQPPQTITPTAPAANDPLAHLPPSPVRTQAPLMSAPPIARSSALGQPMPPGGMQTMSAATSANIKEPPGSLGSPLLQGQVGDKKAGEPTTQGTEATFAKPKSSVMKYLPFLAIGLVVVALAGFLLTRVFGGTKSQPVQGGDSSGTSQNGGQSGGRQTVTGKQTVIKYWGLWEPNEVLAEVFKEYQNQNPGITIEYTKQSHKDYRERLQTAIASGQGPDAFRYHASWVPMLQSELSPIPASAMSVSEFKSAFYPVASEMLQINGQLVGIPLMYDGLALLYNKEIFETAGETPPKTWAELRTTANKLVVRSAKGVERGGIAMGGTANVEHYSDILALLMAQNGTSFSKPNSPETRDALLFYTNFMKTDNVWTDTLPMSSVAFARGDVAMIFAPSWRIHEILATNPNIKIGVAPVPKLSEERIGWATFWAEGISNKSEHKEEVGKLLKYLSSAEVLKKLYTQASTVRAFGELYPRVDMAQDLAQDPYVAAYLDDAPYARGWYLSSFTHDNGINDQLIKYYEDAINAVVQGKQVDETLDTVSQGTTQVLRQYNAP